MNERQMTESMARLDGIRSTRQGKDIGGAPWCNGMKYYADSDGWINVSCLYLKSYDAVHRVLNGLDAETLHRYNFELDHMTRSNVNYEEAFVLFFKATPAQMCEAILRAAGLWVDPQNEEEEVRA